MIFEHSDYRSYLKSILAERISANPAYSLRAFAKHLGVQASHLSGIHRGIRNLSLEAAARISTTLKLPANEAEYFLVLVQLEATKNTTATELRESLLARANALRPKASVTRIQDLSLDAFRAISDWYHIPILEMTALEDKKARTLHSNWVARRLGITSIEVEAAIARLERLDLLEKNSDTGEYRKTYVNGMFKSPGVNIPLRKFHQQMLKKASDALETQSPDERYVGSQTFAVNPAQLKEASAILDACRKKLVALFERGSSKSEVYFLGLQLFSVTQQELKKRRKI